MIVLCPDCSSPFELEDRNIAPLVQVACPTCDYRVILDFEAANDPSLIEEGMGQTSAYRTRESYARAAGGDTVASPSSRPSSPSPRPAARVEVSTETETRKGAASAVQPKPAKATTTPPPAATPAPVPTPASTPAASQPTAPASRPAATTPAAPETQPSSPQPKKTLLGISMPPPSPADAHAPSPESTSSTPESSMPPREHDAPARPRERVRTPPHTPPSTTAAPLTESTDDDAALPAPAMSPASMSNTNMAWNADDDDDFDFGRRTSRPLLWTLIVLLLAVGGLVAASYIQTGELDPRAFILDLLPL